MKKLTIEYIREQFEKVEDKLLTTEYINNRQKLDYICKNGHRHSIGWSDWWNGHKCPYCANRLVCDDNCLKTFYPKLAKELYSIKNGGLTADKILPGSNKKIWWICDKGHEWCTSPNNRVNGGTNCPYCVGNVRLNIEFIGSKFEEEDCILLTKEYINSKQKLDYICPNRHEHSIRWSCWQQGNRCPTCDIINRSGENHYNWLDGITPFHSQIRSWLEKKINWRFQVFVRDKYTCQKCGDSQGGNLNAHHLIPLSDIIEYFNITTIEEAKTCLLLFDINNGITLCEDCHVWVRSNKNINREFLSEILDNKARINV